MDAGEVGRLADETIQLSVRLAGTTFLLALAVQSAWVDGWMEACRQSAAGLEEALARQARTRRLIGQGVPLDAAARGLRLV